jgi:hypothetical protein
MTFPLRWPVLPTGRSVATGPINNTGKKTRHDEKSISLPLRSNYLALLRTIAEKHPYQWPRESLGRRDPLKNHLSTRIPMRRLR